MRGKLWMAPAIAAILFGAPSCARKAVPVANAIPDDTTALAVVDLATLRTTPAYQNLPPNLRSLVQPLASAREFALAWNGKDLLLVAAGDFSQPPSGYTSIGNGVAAAGSADRIAAAKQALNGVARANMQLPGQEIRAEIRGALRRDGALPLTGNLENLANLLRMSELITFSAHVEASVEIDLSAQCKSIDKAQEMEQSLRAMVTVLAGAARDADVAATLSAMRISRESMLVRVFVPTKPDVIQKAF
jgi:hypothetical protein